MKSEEEDEEEGEDAEDTDSDEQETTEATRANREESAEQNATTDFAEAIAIPSAHTRGSQNRSKRKPIIEECEEEH
jgi:hypothetical protein